MFFEPALDEGMQQGAGAHTQGTGPGRTAEGTAADHHQICAEAIGDGHEPRSVIGVKHHHGIGPKLRLTL